MTDAALVLAVDSRQVDKGAKSLDDLAAAGAKAEKAAAAHSVGQDKLSSYLAKSAREAEKQTDAMRQVAESHNAADLALGKYVGMLAGAAVTATLAMVKVTIDFADKMNDLHLKTGLAFESLAAYDQLARQSGTTTEGVAQGFKFLAKYMTEHADKLKMIGVTSKDANVAMGQFADVIAGIQDPALRTTLAMTVLGRSGQDLIPLLMGGSEAFNAAKESTTAYGEALAKVAPEADRLNDKWEVLKTGAKTSALVFVDSLMPALQSVIDLMVRAQKEYGTLAALLAGIGGGALSVFGVELDPQKRAQAELNKLIGEHRDLLTEIARKQAQGAETGTLKARENELRGVIRAQIDYTNALAGTEGAEAAAKRDAAAKKSSDTEVAAMLSRKKDEYIAIKKRADDYLKSLEKEAEQYGLTKAQKEMMNAATIAATLHAGKEREAYMANALAATMATQAQEDATTAKKAAIKAEEELQKQLESGTEAYNKYWNSVDESTAKINENAARLEFENALIGQTAEEISRLTGVRDAEAIATLEGTMAVMRSNNAKDEEVRAIALQIEALYRLKTAREQKPVLESTAKQIEDETKQRVDMWKKVDDVARDTFVNIWGHGKSTLDRLTSTLKNGLLAMLYEMGKKQFLINIGIAGGGMGAAGSAMAGGMGGATGIGASLLGASSAFTGGISSALSMGIFNGFAAGVPLLTSGLTGGFSAGLGLMMPAIGLVAGGVALLSNIIKGNRGTPGTNVGAASTTFSPTGAITGQGSWAGLSPATNQAGVQSFVNMMNDSYRAAAQSLGITAASTIFSLSQNLGKDSKAPQFAIRGGAAGGSEFFSGWTPQSDAAMQLAASKAVLTALQGSELPQYLQKVFKGLKIEVMTQSDIDNTLAFAAALKQTRDALAETRTPLQILSDTAQASIASLGTSATTFRTDFIAAIDAGISPEKLSQWSQLGTMLDQLAQASKDATDSIAASLDSLQGGNANTLLGAQANVNMSMAAVTAAMPWITSFDQLATITMADANNYSVANQILIANALSAGVSLKDLQKTVDPITTQIQQQPTSPTKNIGEVIKRREQQEADILNQKLQMQAEIFKLLGDAAGAAAVLEKQHEITLKGMDASLRPLQKELWALQKAAEEAANAQKLLTDKLSIQAQIAELTGNTTEQAAILEEQRRIALQELAKQDPTGQLGELTAHLWALQAAAQKAAAEQKLLTDKLSVQAQIAELTGNEAEKAAILQQQHQIALQELAKQDPTGQLGELTAELWALQAAAAAAAAAAKLQDDKLSLQAQVYALTGDKAAAAAVLEKQHAIALAALDPSLRELQKQLWGLQAAADAAAKAAAYAQTMGGLQVQLLNAQGKTAEATALERQLALKQIDDAAQRELQKQVWAAQDKAKAEAEAAQAAQAAAQVQAQAAAEAARAAEQLKSAWQSVTDSIFAEVRRIRGLLGADSAGDIQARFAIATAQARAGDQEAAKLLPELSKALLDLASTNATTAQELARIQGRTAASLQTTRMTLSGQYGLQLPSYDVGTPSVPFDMVAQIHKGERIVPASANDTLVAEIRALRQEVASLRTSSAETASATRKTSDLLRNVTQDGNSLLTTPA